MGNLLASIFGGGSQTAPQYQQYDPTKAQSQFTAQNFGGELVAGNNITSTTSAGNLSTFLTGLNGVDSGAVKGINAEQQLGNTLLSGSGAALPQWAQTYLNNSKMQGAESSVNRGVGAFSANGQSGVNQYVGNNALNLVQLGAQFAGNASNQAGGIVNSNMYRFDPLNAIQSSGQIQQAGEFNTGVANEQANANAGVTNYNNNNSPMGNMFRTGLQDLSYLAGSFLGSGGKTPFGNTGVNGSASTGAFA